mgnify:CR=1 FL=1
MSFGKADGSRLVNDEGITTSFNDEQELKASFPIDLIEGGSAKFFREEQ